MGLQEQFGLTDKQTAYVEHVASGVDGAKAAELAGFAPPYATASWNLKKRPHVTAAIAFALRNRLASSAPVALQVLFDIATDPKAREGARVDATKAILDRGGFVAPRMREPEAGDRGLGEMTLDELRTFIRQAQARLAESARVVGS